MPLVRRRPGGTRALESHTRLGARSIVRTARRFELPDAGRQLVGRAAHILAEGEAAEYSGPG